MPLIATRGAASVQGFGEFAQSGPVNYIEDVFSTYLYTGNGSTQTITNGIDLSGKGGLLWIKERANASNHLLFDSQRTLSTRLASNLTNAELAVTNGITSFNNNGFSVGASGATNAIDTYVSWTFRKQPKFFDVVTYTGNGAASRNIAHNLGSVPGCIICKVTSTTGFWGVYHRSTGANGLYLNATNSAGVTLVPTGHTSTTFEVADGYGLDNVNGATYVAYLFAHDAGGFGTSGSDNVISCGSYTGNGSATGPTVTLGYEPQWVLVKRTDSTSNWTLSDNMRGQPVDGATAILNPNLSDAETSATTAVSPTATGFQVKTSGTTFNANGGTYIYIAIRRGPMKTPTTGTSVFSANARTGNGTTQTVTGLSFSPDLWMTKNRGNTQNNWSFDRLRGPDAPLSTNLTDDEATNTTNWFGGTPIFTPTNTGFTTIGQGQVNTNSGSYIDWLFGRAPGFFDVVCYTGTGANRTVSHNLGVAPQLMIVKRRNTTANWPVYTASTATNEYLFLNSGSLPATATTVWNNTAPTSSVFSVGTSALTNANTGTYVAYLFNTVAGVSKVGSYTGTGALQTINCGFTSGARFVLIKLISSGTSGSGDWYVWDSARGISSGNDPYLLINSDTAETTGTNYVDTDSTGFKVTAAGASAINANGDTYIFLAIA